MFSAALQIASLCLWLSVLGGPIQAGEETQESLIISDGGVPPLAAWLFVAPNFPNPLMLLRRCSLLHATFDFKEMGGQNRA